MDVSVFRELTGNIVILGHHNADPDAIGSAVGVRELLGSLAPDVKASVVMPKDISMLSRNIIDSLELGITENYHDSFDGIVIVDTGSLNQLGDWEEKVREAEKLIVIDHHSRNTEITPNKYYFLDEKASSTSEMVHHLMKIAGHIPTQKTAKGLLAGILFDSKFFSIGSASMFNSVSELLELVGDISQVREMFSSEYSVSEKIARLKAAQRMEYSRINGWLIATSELGSYQSSGARALISLGADVAVVTGKDKDTTRSSLRSTNRFYGETGVQLGELVSSVSKHLEGEGSGHPTAAGFNGVCEIEEFTKLILSKLTDLLNN